ncbi:hypothetical protein B6I21_02260 [candidate division KSB1 bacterium 4572_119]|nr:MAG: hypothetical protein B6I21_02260 [candidate division KSB1 bacterium 4572_119]
MKKLLFYLIILIPNLLLAQIDDVQTGDTYKIQRGDIITIYVMEHDEFSANNVIVLPDGYMQYPALGSIMVAGLTPDQLKEVIRENLLPYVPVPLVTVYVARLYKQEINVLGYVNKPGRYQIFEPIDILTAIALAGGLEKLKDAEKIKIIRSDGRSYNLTLKLIWELNKNNSKNGATRKVLLYPGDTLLIIKPKKVNWGLITTIASLINLVVMSTYYLTK